MILYRQFSKQKRILATAAAVILAAVLFSVTVFAADFDEYEIYPSVFLVATETGHGSGFAVGPNVILTSAELVEDARVVEATSYSGMVYPAKVYVGNMDKDIAVIVTEGSDFIPLPINEIYETNVGDTVYTVDTSQKMDYKLKETTIPVKNRIVFNQKYIQLEDFVDDANSGGPLLNTAGEVIGMNTRGMSQREGEGLSVPIGDVVAYLQEEGVFSRDSNGMNSIAEFELSENGGNAAEDLMSQENGMADTLMHNDTVADGMTEDMRVVFFVLLTCSVLLNIILILYIVLKKRRNEKQETQIDEEEKRKKYEQYAEMKYIEMQYNEYKYNENQKKKTEQ